MISRDPYIDAIGTNSEYAPLRSVVVGRAEFSCFPNEPTEMIKTIMPRAYYHEFRPSHPFPQRIVHNATWELDVLHEVLDNMGITVYRPQKVNWAENGGYSAAMPRNGLFAIGQTIIEAPLAWTSRRNEVSLAYGEILNDLRLNKYNRVIRAPENIETGPVYTMSLASLRGPKLSRRDSVRNMFGRAFNHSRQSSRTTISSQVSSRGSSRDSSPPSSNTSTWAINESRPVFDASDFVRFGTLILGQLSHVTNMKGIEYLQSVLPKGHTIELLEVDKAIPLHLSATILPLREGLLIYNPMRTTPYAIRKHKALQHWDIRACPLPKERGEYDPPLLMSSNWLMMDILSLDRNTVIIEQSDTEFAEWLNDLGVRTIKLPFKNVQALGGSFRSATVDVLRYDRYRW